MTTPSPLPPYLRVRLAARWARRAAGSRNPGDVARAMASVFAPGRMPPPEPLRMGLLDQAVAAGSLGAARVVLADLASHPNGSRPGTLVARRRAAALDVVAPTLPPVGRRTETTVAAYLRGELAPAASPPHGDLTAEAVAADRASLLRAAGWADPVILATYPAFHANPYSRLMERAYAGHGLAAVHVDRVEDVDAIVAGAATGGYRAAVHLNAPDRFVRSVRDTEAAATTAAGTWSASTPGSPRGQRCVTTIHNGPRYEGYIGAAERVVAQGILDRAAMIHVLAAATPRLLAGWVTLDPARVVHVPHPSYDGAYAPLPPSDEARAALDIAPGDAAVVAGLIGSLADRKGGLLLLDAMARVPATLPDGRELRLLIAGMPSGRRSEELIRRAIGDPRVVARFGFVPDEELPALLAAIDVAVVPYAQYLNSGWLHLALTAGHPAIAPAGGTPEEIVLPGALLTFAPQDPAALAAVLERSGDLTTRAARAAARAWWRTSMPIGSGAVRDRVPARHRPRGLVPRQQRTVTVDRAGPPTAPAPPAPPAADRTHARAPASLRATRRRPGWRAAGTEATP